MLKLAGEFIEGQLADHMARLDAHTRNLFEVLRTGEYTYLHPFTDKPGTLTVTADRLYGMPILVARDLTLDRIGIEVTTADAGKNARLGIYNNGTNLEPGTLLLDVGEVSVASVAIVTVTINQALTKGIYWAAFISDGTPAVRSMYLDPGMIGFYSSSFAYTVCTWYASQTYGTLPDPFPTTSLNPYYHAPIVIQRIASLD